jgi:glutathione S-transferase
MNKLKLVYFDMDGGRGETARLALSIAGIAFEDDRIAFPDWPKCKDETPYGAIPVLTVNGERLAQSNAINRYVGKLAGLYPDNAWQAAFCDEVMDSVEDLMNAIVPTLFMPEEEKIKARKALAEGPIPFFLERLEARLIERGGEHFADDRFTVADLKVFLLTRFLSSGALDFVPADIVKNAAPKLVDHCERVGAHPGVVSYYEGRKRAS